MRCDRWFPALCSILLLVGACASYEKIPAPVTQWQGDMARVRLEYRGTARAVHAVGDFNDWNPEANPFINTGNEIWSCVLDLSPGRHAYLLVVETDSDLTWRLDPANPDRGKDFLGRELSLLVVEDSAGGKSDDGAAGKRENR